MRAFCMRGLFARGNKHRQVPKQGIGVYAQKCTHIDIFSNC